MSMHGFRPLFRSPWSMNNLQLCTYSSLAFKSLKFSVGASSNIDCCVTVTTLWWDDNDDCLLSKRAGFDSAEGLLVSVWQSCLDLTLMLNLCFRWFSSQAHFISVSKVETRWECLLNQLLVCCWKATAIFTQKASICYRLFAQFITLWKVSV